jgi:phosphoglycerol transferase MdoB-like AlkP superfamily enzyme
MVLLGFFKNNVFKPVVKTVTLVCLFISALVLVIDLELYKYWGFRLDFTPLLYLNTPGEMVASVSYFVVARQLILGAIIVVSAYYIYKRTIEKEIDKIQKETVIQAIVFLVLTGAMIIPIRGGFGLAPLNTGSAYFSQNQYANHAANNVVWNLAFSFTYYKESKKNPFQWTDEANAREEITKLYSGKGSGKKMLKIERPNIVLIIVESFTKNVIGHIVENKNITPNISKYCKEGIYFNNFYANGNRTDKGMVAIFSGFPSQPIASIIKFPYKTEQLPFLTKDLKQKGYTCSFYYGGDVDFAAMRSYIQNASFDELITDKEFPKSTYSAKWGVHDEFAVERFLNDIQNSKSRFFKAWLTISNHEPFDVPMKPVFKGTTDEYKFFNTCYYTDSVLGIFVEKMKKSKFWDSTLIIITADHGARNPGNMDYYDDRCFAIPMLWLGGAINKGGEQVNIIGSQSDIALTLLNQMNLKNEKDYFYSKDLLSDSCKSFAYYAFNSGFGLLTDSCRIIYDNNSTKLLKNEGRCSEALINIGKCYQQVVYSDFLQEKKLKKEKSK